MLLKDDFKEEVNGKKIKYLNYKKPEFELKINPAEQRKYILKCC